MADRSNRLPILAARIKDSIADMRKSAEAAAQRALDAGADLIEAKRHVPHGRWRQWLQDHCDLSERSAQRYMQLVRAGLKSATVADLGIRGALEGKSAPALTPEEQVAAFFKQVLGERIGEFIERLGAPDGEVFWFELQAALQRKHLKITQDRIRIAGERAAQAHLRMVSYD